METSTRQQFCGDTLNIFGREDQNFQWSRAYSYYSSPPAQKDIIWASESLALGVFLRFLSVKNLLHGVWTSTCQAKELYNSKIIL
jgi:hypothetical protein